MGERVAKFPALIADLRASGSELSTRAADGMESLGDYLGESLGAYNRLVFAVEGELFKADASPADIVAALRTNADILGAKRAREWAEKLIPTLPRKPPD